MLKNYLKIAFRSLWRHKGFSILNICGLAVGMTAFFLVCQYVRLETGYDSFNSKSDRIYRINADLYAGGVPVRIPYTTIPMGPNMKAEFPEVEDYVRFCGFNLMFRSGDVKFYENSTYMADSSLFRIFDVKLKKGDPASALREPYGVVLSETTARKYFGDRDPMGQPIHMAQQDFEMRVTGVMQDIPENSTIKADVFVSMAAIRKFRDSADFQWGNFSAFTYLLLRPGADAQRLQAKFPGFVEAHIGKGLRERQEKHVYTLERLRDTYWSARGGFVTGSKRNVYIFSIVGLFLLVIACINFINLTTARSTERAKEVGVRKVVGAARGQLTRQFLGESIVIALLAFLLCLCLCPLLLPFFNGLAGKTIATGVFDAPSQIALLFGVAVGCGLLAGAYPALILSSFHPMNSLKGRFSNGARGVLLRKGLVVAQFTISIVLIIGTTVIYSQLQYLRGMDLGFDTDETLVLDTHLDKNRVAMRDAASRTPGVQAASFSGSIPGAGTYSAYSNLENKKGEMQPMNIDLTYVDFGYMEQYGMKLLAGRYFNKEIATDTMQAMIINEKTLAVLGYANPAEAVGRRFSQWGKKGVIIGVIRNYNFDGLQKEVLPLTICLNFDDCNYLSLKVRSRDVPMTLAALKKDWEQVLPSQPWDYSFLNESFNKQYRGEERFGRLFICCAFLAIFISCLGLLGLSSYSIVQRTKEVGVRRVLGASVGSVVRLLSVDFLKLVVVAFVVASPVAWWLMHQWLQDFAYRMVLGWWMFAGAGLLAVMVALATIGYQAVRAATANPVKSLRSE